MAGRAVKRKEECPFKQRLDNSTRSMVHLWENVEDPAHRTMVEEAAETIMNATSGLYSSSVRAGYLR